MRATMPHMRRTRGYEGFLRKTSTERQIQERELARKYIGAKRRRLGADSYSFDHPKNPSPWARPTSSRLRTRDIRKIIAASLRRRTPSTSSSNLELCPRPKSIRSAACSVFFLPLLRTGISIHRIIPSLNSELFDLFLVRRTHAPARITTQ